MKRTIYKFIVFVFISLLFISSSCFSISNSDEIFSDGVDFKNTMSSASSYMTDENAASNVIDLLSCDESIQYYAYLNINDSDTTLSSVIYEARKKLVSRYNWVADDVPHGYIRSPTGEVVAELPHFSDLFPAEWYYQIWN